MTAMDFRESLWQKAVDFHGHSCPGLAAGVRVSLDFMEKLNIQNRAEDEELVAVLESDACGVDGVQVILGCTAGKGNLWLKKRGKNVFTLYQRSTGQGVRYSWQGYGAKEMPSEEKVEYFLHGPPKELYTVAPPRYPIPPSAAIHHSIYCDLCGERTAEPNIRVSEGKMVCLDCAGFAFNFQTRIAL